MSSHSIKKNLFDDFLSVPEHMVAEIIDGELHATPRPAPKHARAYSSLGDELVSPFDKGKDGPGGWWILDEPELHLDDQILVPDIAGWRCERMPTLPETAWFELPLDWVCEILSPSTAQTDRIKKIPIYAQQGVQHICLIDPDVRTLETFELIDNKWTLIASLKEDDPVSVPPFNAITFDLSVLWAD